MALLRDMGQFVPKECAAFRTVRFVAAGGEEDVGPDREGQGAERPRRGGRILPVVDLDMREIESE
jgi:hypothetical protein